MGDKQSKPKEKDSTHSKARGMSSNSSSSKRRGSHASKPKGKYLKELHKQVPNMKMDEIMQSYEDFKQSTNGKDKMSKQDFVEVYTIAFGSNSVAQLAENIFNTFDADNSGLVDFQEFLIGLSITESSDPNDKGNMMKKLKWAFDVYDKDKSGSIDRTEMRLIVKVIV